MKKNMKKLLTGTIIVGLLTITLLKLTSIKLCSESIDPPVPGTIMLFYK